MLNSGPPVCYGQIHMPVIIEITRGEKERSQRGTQSLGRLECSISIAKHDRDCAPSSGIGLVVSIPVRGYCQIELAIAIKVGGNDIIAGGNPGIEEAGCLECAVAVA